MIETVFGVSSVCDFYAKPFSELFEIKNTLRLVSIGSGDCCYEMEICRFLLRNNHTNFHFLCLEVNERLIAQAKTKIKEASLDKWLDIEIFDINRESLNFPVDGFMAHHSLHHIVELERLFASIDRCLLPHGRFLTQDMIGRNGHMRWPETLGVINGLWATIDDSKKFNHQFGVKQNEYVNYDCSTEGFEGVRAQDILPLLISHFTFTGFVATGGLIEVFVDRGFGHNYTTENKGDLEFIDFVADINDRMIELGLIKPTIVFAEMRKKGQMISPRLYKGLTPQFCLRRT
jgi:SAM-dependent methyltransferase